MKLLVYYVVETHLASTKAAVFSAGGGAYEGFSQCSWETLGNGQYQDGDEPLTQVKEVKVEIFCREEVVSAVIDALTEAHPCDSPIHYWLEV